MPELPEVETMRRSIEAAAGCRIERVERPQHGLRSIVISPNFKKFQEAAAKKRILAVERLGKRIVLKLDSNGDCIVLEPRMTGIVMPDDPPNEKHLRLIFYLSGGDLERILFWDQRGLGIARYLSNENFQRLFGPEKIGPDALSVTPEILQERLGKSSRPIKVALLDQKFIAGIGNLYASEVLHLAGIHPALPCNKLERPQWVRLCRAISRVLRAAIRHQGSTLRDNTYRVGREKTGGYQAFHRVYQRAGQQCLTCGKAKIVRIVQAQRSTFFCPICQTPCEIEKQG